MKLKIRQNKALKYERFNPVSGLNGRLFSNATSSVVDDKGAHGHPNRVLLRFQHIFLT